MKVLKFFTGLGIGLKAMVNKKEDRLLEYSSIDKKGFFTSFKREFFTDIKNSDKDKK